MSETSNTTPTAVSTETPKSKDPGELSFSEYQAYRRTGEMPKAEVTETKSESAENTPEAQNEAEQSGNSASEENKESDVSDEHEGDEPEGKSDEDVDAKPKKKGGFQRRIDKLTREREFWREQALKNGQTSGQAQTQTQPTADGPKAPAAAQGKPDPNKYETHEAYLDARDEWNRQQWRSEQERDRLASENTKVQKAYAERLSVFVQDHPDYEEVMATTEAVTTPLIEQVISTSEIGPALRYELAKNPDEALRIAKLPPIVAAKELGKLEDRIASKSESEKKPEPKKITNAPKPIEPVSGVKAKVAKSIDDPDLSFADYVRLRRDQKKHKSA